MKKILIALIISLISGTLYAESNLSNHEVKDSKYILDNFVLQKPSQNTIQQSPDSDFILPNPPVGPSCSGNPACVICIDGYVCVTQ